MNNVLWSSSLLSEVAVIGEILGVDVAGIEVGTDACSVSWMDACAEPATEVASVLGSIVGICGAADGPGIAHAIIAIRIAKKPLR